MLPRLRRTFFSSFLGTVGLYTILLSCALDVQATPGRSNVVLRENISLSRREYLAEKLRKITGLPALSVDDAGILREGKMQPTGGSPLARALIIEAIRGDKAVVVEAVSKDRNVAFCRVLSAKWRNPASGNPPAFVVQIDFDDFEQLVGDERALEAFDAGWGLLHELDHIVNDHSDAALLGQAGECEDHINRMRRECDLPVRTNYFYTLFPRSSENTFITRFVRLSFEESSERATGPRSYAITWDANVVGGVDERKEIAAVK